MAEHNQTIENSFREFFKGDELVTALDFAEFLETNNMIRGKNCEIHYKNELACYLDTPSEQNKWFRIWTVGDFSNEYEGFPINENTKEIARANVVKCGGCGGANNCAPGKTEVIFGQEFENVCNAVMAFYMPDAEALECVKKLLDMRKRRLTV